MGLLNSGLGWTRLLAFVIAKVYLVCMLTLGAIALAPALLGWHTTVVQTGSMMPHISPGDAVVISPWAVRDPAPLGGVVQYESPAAAEADGVARMKLHRIVTANEDGSFTTAGDANADVDSVPLVREQIAGIGRLLVPYIGLPGLWFTQGKLGLLALWSVFTAGCVWLTASGPMRKRSDDVVRASEGFATAPGASRRSVLSLGLLAAAGACLGGSSVQSRAAFASTTSAKSSWSTAPLVPHSVLTHLKTAVTAYWSVIKDAPGSGWPVVNGRVAISPGLLFGIPTGSVSGRVNVADATARAARAEASRLAQQIDSLPASVVEVAELSGRVSPGVYRCKKPLVIDFIQLDAEKNSDAQFVFIAPEIVFGSSSSVSMVRFAQAEHVFWRSTGSLTVRPNSTVYGSLLASGDVEVKSNAKVRGAVASLGGSVLLGKASVGF